MTRKMGPWSVAAVTMMVLYACTQARAGESARVMLQGTVSSQEEGRMEGVLVSAKAVGSTVTVTVVSDSQGRYVIPNGTLHPGRYHVTVRATGYDYDSTGSVELSPNKTAQMDLKLHKTGDLASQLTNAEWLLSAPGTEQQK